MVPTMEQAHVLLSKHMANDALLKHAYAVSGVCRHFADKFGEDTEYWAAVGLLHDLDYERYPDEHCKKTAEIMAEEGLDPAFIRAVVSHGWGLCYDVEPISTMEKVLYATDELCGLINAAALMRPSKSVMDIEYSSVNKKFKDPRFAAGVNRDVIKNGAAMLGMELKDLIDETILGMRKVAAEIGLA
ncbi:MAG: HDIG domain-containing protein [Defluviitaleaceae bacterium]|nr:HDIG domain-containing protein [Defluviitaleaceae bacterium]